MVVGGGSAGVRCSRRAAAFGARVALCEEKDLGGTCVNVGCVPKKLFAYGAHYPEHFEDAKGYGWQVGDPILDWKVLIANKNTEISRLNAIYGRMLKRAGVEVVQGRGVVTGRHEVTVGDRTFSAHQIVIATGGSPFVPDFDGREYVSTSNDIFDLPERPDRVLIAGGGYIGVEFASIFNGYGAEVDLVHRGELFLRGFDEDCRHAVANEMRKLGVRLHFNCTFDSVGKRSDGRFDVCLTDGESLVADLVLAAVGRRPNTRGLGLEALGVQLSDRGGVIVDDELRTSVRHIFAIGDVIERVELTPVALAEGEVLARNLFGPDTARVDYTDIPTAVFSNPTLSSVGLTEAEARERFDRIRIYKAQFRPLLHTMTGRDSKIFMKLIVDDASDRVVACHMVGPEAAELIQGLAVAMKAGATKAHFDATLGIHPTAAEEFVTMRKPASE